MKTISFTKMHGLGNDFVIIDNRVDIVKLAREEIMLLTDRKRGVGCDQLIMIEPGPKLRILNADGSEVETCGNALRCVGLLLRDELGDIFTLTTGAGVHNINASDRCNIQVSMGKGLYMAPPPDFIHGPLNNPEHVSVGNPHLIFFVPSVDTIPLEILGPQIETHRLFPNRINVEIAETIGEHEITMRVWERGAGLTDACGSGACAVGFAAVKKRLVKTPVTIHMPGGSLKIDVTTDDEIVMTGPATLSFRGEVDLV